ncbi:MAG: DUF4170 domain-containing protein [Alphaproteobacteria bacterium]|nr:DUF4170 domain-containing protein [Alphaproteobacteria bacterium]
MAKQLLHLVFGGRVKDPKGVEFLDLNALDIVGFYPNFKTAYAAWRAKAQSTIDDAQMKYVVVHMHRMLEPDFTSTKGGIEHDSEKH